MSGLRWCRQAKLIHMRKLGYGIAAGAALLAVSSCSLGGAHETAAPAAATAPAATTTAAPAIAAGGAAAAAIAGPAIETSTARADAGTGTATPATVTLTAVGDTMLGSTPDLPPSPGTYL